MPSTQGHPSICLAAYRRLPLTLVHVVSLKRYVKSTFYRPILIHSKDFSVNFRKRSHKLYGRRVVAVIFEYNVELHLSKQCLKMYLELSCIELFFLIDYQQDFTKAHMSINLAKRNHTFHI